MSEKWCDEIAECTALFEDELAAQAAQADDKRHRAAKIARLNYVESSARDVAPLATQLLDNVIVAPFVVDQAAVVPSVVERLRGRLLRFKSEQSELFAVNRDLMRRLEVVTRNYCDLQRQFEYLAMCYNRDCCAPSPRDATIADTVADTNEQCPTTPLANRRQNKRRRRRNETPLLESE